MHRAGLSTHSMEKPARRDLLPGVSQTGAPPAVSCESRRIIVSARRRAAFRDTFDLLLLGAVDGLFLRWPHAHVPSLGRDQTAVIVAAANALVITYMWSARTFPRWRARRVASTWSMSEQNRFSRF
jgi:hypothetical protein